MHLFIDSNIFLRFYGYSDDRLEELKKLGLLIDRGEVFLYIPQQLKNEVYRNRENVIKSAYKDLADIKLERGFPYIFRSHNQFSELEKILNRFSEVKKKILNELTSDIENRRLKADLVIDELINKGLQIKTDSFIVEAKLRMDLGNPPGKNASLGDAINWQCLLETVPHGADLFLISKDSDYSSPLSEDKLNGYLNDEWRKSKSSEVFFYNSLTSWAKNNQKDLFAKLEYEKSSLIERLLQSKSYAETHLIISHLSQHQDFTSDQLNQILSAGYFNHQVRDLLKDWDVEEFYKNLLLVIDDRVDLSLLPAYSHILNSDEKQNIESDVILPPF